MSGLRADLARAQKFLDDQPPGTSIVDSYGDVWRNDRIYWYRHGDSGYSPLSSWELCQRAPLDVCDAPVQQVYDADSVQRHSGNCPMGVTRSGVFQPCDKIPVAMRWVEFEGIAQATPVCVAHSRVGQMLSLSETIKRRDEACNPQ